jgi:hypothetical protein
MKHRYLTIWLTYCISIALYTVLVRHTCWTYHPHVSIYYVIYFTPYAVLLTGLITHL